MPEAQQDLSTGNYRAVIPIAAARMAAPSRNTTDGSLQALLDLITLVDQTGAAIGTAGNPLVTSSTGTVGSSTATTASVAASATSGQVLAANSNRKDAIFNNSGSAGNIYLLAGTGTASATNYTQVIYPLGSWPLPVDYLGAFQAVWSTTSGAGSLLVTEFS